MLLTGIPGTMKKEAAVIYHRIRDEGNSLHNLDCYAKGEGEIRTARAPQPSSVESKNFISCSACKKFYPGKSFKLHKCLDSKKKPPTLADYRRRQESLISKEKPGMQRVLRELSNDSVGKIIRLDETLMAYLRYRVRNKYGTGNFQCFGSIFIESGSGSKLLLTTIINFLTFLYYFTIKRFSSRKNPDPNPERP